MTLPPASDTQPRPIAWLWVVALFATTLALPAFLERESLRTFSIQGDDFVYFAGSRTFADLSAQLFKPHNAHVVPLFRLWTYALTLLAGSITNWPAAALAASYLTMVGAILGVGHVVAWETRRLSWALAAMIGVALSTTLMPTVAWYSAGQALLAGVVGVHAIAAFQFWRWTGRRFWVVLGVLGTLAAPWIWSGGYVFGPAGFVYLWLDGRKVAKRAAWLPLAASVLMLMLSVAIAGLGVFRGEAAKPGEAKRSADLVAGAFHTCQAIPEVLVAARFGLDAVTTPLQGVALCAMLAAAWAWSRGGKVRPNPLEGAGALLVVGGFGLAYTFRGSYSFDSLRGIYWYQAIPELGGFLFLAGWALALRDVPALPGMYRRPSRIDTLLLIGLTVLTLTAQWPRAGRAFLIEIPPMTESERRQFPIPELVQLRARYLASERVERQGRFLSRLDRAEAIARVEKLSRATLRAEFGRVLGPGMPQAVPDLDAVSLLALPESGGAPMRPAIRQSFAPLFTPEPVQRPAWLTKGEAWNPKDW